MYNGRAFIERLCCTSLALLFVFSCNPNPPQLLIALYSLTLVTLSCLSWSSHFKLLLEVSFCCICHFHQLSTLWDSLTLRTETASSKSILPPPGFIQNSSNLTLHLTRFIVTPVFISIYIQIFSGYLGGLSSQCLDIEKKNIACVYGREMVHCLG